MKPAGLEEKKENLRKAVNRKKPQAKITV